MRTLFAIVLFASLPALAAEPKPAPDPEKVRQACKAEAAKAPVENPADAVAVQRNAFNLCMRLAGFASGPIRAK